MSNIATLGKDEQSEGALFIRVLNPTDFDNASEAMRKYLKNQLGFLDEWKYLGLTGGPLREFLHRYIDTSHFFGSSYNVFQKEKWFDYLKTKYGYSNTELEIYFGAYDTVNSQGKIPASISQAYNYTPTKDTAFTEMLKGAAKYAFWGVGIYAVSYLLLREKLFGTKKRT